MPIVSLTEEPPVRYEAPGKRPAPIATGLQAEERDEEGGLHSHQPMTATRPAIPEEVKRAVRQHCGFGCAICGLPIYQYEHIDDWAEVRSHQAENLVLLCPNHHEEKTKGLRTREQVRSARLEPANKKGRFSAPYELPYRAPTDRCTIWIGDNSFSAEFGAEPTSIHAVVIDHLDILSFWMREGGLYLNLVLMDECNDAVLCIRSNEMVFARGQWDITFVGRNLVIREGPGDVRIDLVFEVPATVRINKARFLCNGVAVLISPRGIVIPGQQGSVLMTGTRGRNGLILGSDEPAIQPLPMRVSGAMFGLSRIPRYGALIDYNQS